MKPRFLDAAEAEFLSAARDYSMQRDGLGDEFRQEVMKVVQNIGREPLKFGRYEGSRRMTNLRRALVRRFPYVIIFDVRPREILIVSVTHSSRRPGHWKDRQ